MGWRGLVGWWGGGVVFYSRAYTEVGNPIPTVLCDEPLFDFVSFVSMATRKNLGFLFTSLQAPHRSALPQIRANSRT